MVDAGFDEFVRSRWDDLQRGETISLQFLVPSRLAAYKFKLSKVRSETLFDQPASVFQLANPIGFDAPDEQPVQLLIFLLVPEAATQKHLEILSEIAELLSDSALREQMKQAPQAASLHGLISGWQSAHAAA